MKQCPACNFSFPDFHQVCDFDGTELIPDPSRPSVPPPARQSRLLRLMKSPVLWAVLLLVFVLSTAFLTAYLDATQESAPLAQTASPADSVANNRIGTDQASDQLQPAGPDRDSAISNSTKRSAAVRHTRNVRPTQSLRTSQSRVARWRKSESSSRTAGGHRSVKPEIVRTDAKRESSDKAPKLTAMLKTTWRVLSKPFRF